MVTISDPVAAVRELLRRSLLTLAAIPDPDVRFRAGPKTAWPAYVRESRDAYASAPPKIRAFTPSQRDIGVFMEALEWLAWYRRQNHRADENVRLFTAWVFGAPIWMLQQRISTNRRAPASKQTVYDRLDRVVEAVIEAFPDQVRRAAFDKSDELDQFCPPDSDGGQSVSTDLRDLPTSPRHHMEPGAKPRHLNASERAELQKQERESEQRRRRAQRRKRPNQRPKSKKNARKNAGKRGSR